MRRYICELPNGRIFPILSSLDARYKFGLEKRRISRGILIATLSFWVSPFFFLIFVILAVVKYNKEVYEVFFRQKEVKAMYNSILKPMVSPTLYSTLGYRVYPEELEDHLRLVNSDEKEEMKELGKKGQRMRKIPHRQFGFNVDKATRHHMFLGTTGAGKTETIMSFYIDVVRGGGGIGMIDGKSDQAMEYKIYNLCAENYYETQFYAIILNKPEKNTESNSYSPLLGYESAMKASEFLGEFIGGGGDGNADYFANRGKVMLGNVVMYYKYRQNYYDEKFSIPDLALSSSQTELSNLYYLSYSVIMELEQLIKEKIKRNPSFKRIIDKAKEIKTAQSEEVKNCELLYEYVNQNSHLTRNIEVILGVKYNFFSDHYNLFTSMDVYFSAISESWSKFTKVIARAIYLSYRSKERSFLYTSSLPVKMAEVRIFFGKLKDKSSTEAENSLRLLADEYGDAEKELFQTAIGHEDDAEETIDNINQDAMMQHQYATQQWSRVFDLFKIYLGIFGTPNPDVDGEDILKNNKVLYIMLPVMELSPDQIKTLGKMFILMFKSIASIALGGENQSATPMQFKIYQNKVKPNPIFLMVLDELGSYMTNNLSFLLSQVRSLRIGMLLSLQDMVSAKPAGGDGDIEQKRNIANVGKILLQNRDGDTEEFAKMVQKVKVINSDGYLRSAINDSVISNHTLKIEEVPAVSMAVTSRFQKGMALYIDGGSLEPIIFQSYYIGDNAKQALQIRRFSTFRSLYNN